MNIKNLLLGLITCLTLAMHADNPIVPDFGMADPHIYIFNGKPYLFTTRDSSKTAKSFIMPDWHIWTTDDMVSWNLVRTIKPTETWMGQSTRCWATETVTKNGKYYFYFSNGNESTGVMVADKPEGPYTDVLGKPMLPKDLTPTKEYDPGVLIDDDGKAYISFGHHRSNDDDYYYMIARLNEDMISLAEAPKEIKITGNVEGGILNGNDKPNLHKKNGIYYLSAGSHYATSKNIYGPYAKTGNSGNNDYGLDGKAHGNYFDWNNQSFHTWCHFHLGKDVARFRESYIAYLHYKDNGEMVTDTDFLDQHFKTGVGQYDATWDKIEAEWYMKAENIKKRECPNGGFEVVSYNEDGAIYFPNIHNLHKSKTIELFVASEGKSEIIIYSGADKDVLLGSCKINDTKGRYQQFRCRLSDTTGAENLLVTFKDNAQVHLDWLKLK